MRCMVSLPAAMLCLAWLLDGALTMSHTWSRCSCLDVGSSPVTLFVQSLSNNDPKIFRETSVSSWFDFDSSFTWLSLDSVSSTLDNIVQKIKCRRTPWHCHIWDIAKLEFLMQIWKSPRGREILEDNMNWKQLIIKHNNPTMIDYNVATAGVSLFGIHSWTMGTSDFPRSP